MSKNYPFALLVLFWGAMIFASSSPDPLSTGAPPSSSGAPGEKSCTNAGCHDTYSANSGTGAVEFSFAGGSTSYEPGKSYDVTVTVKQPSVTRFGFEVVALRSSDNANAGKLTLTEPARTQLLDGIPSFSERKYLTYTSAGTNPVAAGTGQWSFRWTAPAADEGDITFYTAGLAANNDGTDYGDNVYLLSTKINSSVNASLPRPQFSYLPDFHYENPVTGSSITFFFRVRQNSVPVEVALISLNGKTAGTIYKNERAKGEYFEHFGLDKKFSPGIYLLQAKIGEEVFTNKILVL